MPRALLILVAAAIPAWWVALFASEAFRSVFASADAWPALRVCLWPDLGLAAITGFAALRPSVGVAATACGAWGYATLWTLSAHLAGAVLPLGAASMIVGLVVVLLALRALVSPSRSGAH